MEIHKIVRFLNIEGNHPCAIIRIREGGEKAFDVQRILDIVGDEYPVFSLLFSHDAKTIYTVSSPWLYCKLNQLEHLVAITSLNESDLNSRQNGLEEITYLYLIDVDSYSDYLPQVLIDLLNRPRYGVYVLFLTSRERSEFVGFDYYNIL